MFSTLPCAEQVAKEEAITIDENEPVVTKRERLSNETSTESDHPEGEERPASTKSTKTKSKEDDNADCTVVIPPPGP